MLGYAADMAGVLLTPPATHWECPNCDLTQVTHVAGPHTRMHTCPGLKGLTAPMVAAGTRAKVEAVVRGDYVGREVVQTDDEGVPVSFVVTTRDDGNDVAALAPCATAFVDA